jgi:hypothetical protein
VRAGNTRLADDALGGFNDQFYNWQTSVSLQQQLREGMALNVGYFRTWYSGFNATDNRAVTPANFSPYCITAPVDSRLPGGGGNQICGLYDVNPARSASPTTWHLVIELRRPRSLNGVTSPLNSRFAQAAVFSLSVGRTVTDNCYTVAIRSWHRRQCHQHDPQARVTTATSPGQGRPRRR